MDKATQDRIEKRAYQIWLREGCPHGRDQEHWRQAEQEIAKEYHAAPQTDSQPRPSVDPAPIDSRPGASPTAGTDGAPKKRAARAKLKEDPGAETKGKPSKKQAGDSAIREPPRK